MRKAKQSLPSTTHAQVEWLCHSTISIRISSWLTKVKEEEQKIAEKYKKCDYD
jgi:hypothetical protein